ncbi:MAG: hypothetical protein IIZ93_12145 [Acidaminococcaceae bacterium]|nr:hypothetical protein [Acidaminococcaceae bacterium]
MKCVGCPHFKILYDPIGKAPEIWDFGKAKCVKHDLYVDFASKRKLNKLTCWEEEMSLAKWMEEQDAGN